MLQQFLRTATDGWDLALASVRNLFAEADLHADEVGGDFAGEADRLGEATAEVHAAWPSTSRTATLGRARARRAGRRMTDRLDAALPVVPELGRRAPTAARRVRRVGRSSAAVPVQRVHGDLHLGQTLRTVNGLEARRLRGRAGQAARRAGAARTRRCATSPACSAPSTTPPRGRRGADQGARREQLAYRAASGPTRNRDAFLRRLRRGGGHRPPRRSRSCCAALRADKAVYEAVYEARNRPDLAGDPAGSAIARLGDRSGGRT